MKNKKKNNAGLKVKTGVKAGAIKAELMANPDVWSGGSRTR